MPTDRVLVEIVTAANMAGIEQAKAGFLGMNFATLGLAAGLTVLVAGGKSMIENSRQFEDAQLSLAQALGHSKTTVTEFQAIFDKWSETNKRYIPNQFEAERALASFIRAGSRGKEAMQLLNDALDISIIKGDNMTDSAKMLTLALNGNSKGLRFLGISTVEYNGIMKSHLTTAQKHHALLALIEKKTKDGRKAQDDLKQSGNELNHNWQELSKKGGPVLTTLLNTVVSWLNHAYDWFDKIGKDDKLWSNISDRLVNMAAWIKKWIIDPIQFVYGLINGGPGSRQGAANTVAQQAGRYGYGGTPATTTPGNGKGPQTAINIQIDGMADGPTIDRMTTAIAQRLRFTTGI